MEDATFVQFWPTMDVHHRYSSWGLKTGNHTYSHHQSNMMEGRIYLFFYIYKLPLYLEICTMRVNSHSNR